MALSRITAPPLLPPALGAIQRADDRELRRLAPKKEQKFSKGEKKRYVAAYEKARYYHETSDNAVDMAGGIREAGLLISKGATGFTKAQGFSNDEFYNRNTIHVTDARMRDFYKKRRIRPFLPANRERLDVPWDPEGKFNRNFREEYKDRKQHLFRDLEHTNLGVWITGADIPPEAIHFGATDELADVGNDAIFNAIATHWDGKKGVPSTDELRALHRIAVKKKRLSLPVKK